MIFEYVTCV